MPVRTDVEPVRGARTAAGGSRPPGLLGALAVVAPALGVAVWAIRSLGGVPTRELVLPWAPELGLVLTFRVDALSSLMLAVLGVVGVAVALHASAYLTVGRARFGALVLAFGTAMAGLVTTDDVLGLYAFWELTSVTSYLLIGFHDRSASARAAARQAFVTTGAGGLALLAGLLLLASEAGTFRLSGVVAAAPASATAAAALALVLVGATTKSAQVPWHGWLPAASAAPAPASALLHSATMVKAGVYLVARLAPGFAGRPVWQVLVLGLGSTTVVWGGLRAVAQDDLKRLLAFSTVAQLGLLIVVLGSGTPKGLAAGLAMLVAHAAAKAALFLGTGTLEKRIGSRQLDAVAGVGRRHPWLGAAMTAAAVSLAGLPPTLGYAAKEAGLAAVLADAPWWAVVAVVAGGALTVAYAGRIVVTLWRPARAGAPAQAADDGGAAPPLLAAPVVVLAAIPIGLALRMGGTSEVVATAASALLADAPSVLVWWPGPVPALGLSALAIVLGATGLAIAERRGWPRERPLGPSASDVLAGLERVAVRVTARVQSGSLPAYLAVLVGVAVLVPLGAWSLEGGEVPAGVPLAGGAAEVVLAAVVLAAAVGVVRARSRFAAVLSLGGVGYAMTGLFVLRSAPDLALTQAVIETVTLLAFALVLGRVPGRPAPAPVAVPRWLRGLLAVGVGTLAGVVALVAGAATPPDAAGVAAAATSVEVTGAANVVNGILTDLRALDTLGEIVVLAVAALGVLALARTGGTRPLAGTTPEGASRARRP